MKRPQEELRNGKDMSMGKIYHLVIKIFILSCTLISFQLNAAEKKKDDMFIKAEIDKQSPYEGEAFVLTYNLYSKNPDVAYANRLSKTDLNGGQYSFYSRIDTDSRGRKITLDNEVFYVFPLESYIVSIDKKGSYSFSGGEFDIKVKYPVIYDDPFWGRRRGYQTEQVNLPVYGIKFKVRNVPSSQAHDASSAVGSFKVTSQVPPGDIILDQPGRVIITLKGRGKLDEDVLPEYQEAFKEEGVRLKSMTENRKNYFDGVGLVSEIVLDCEFIPSQKEVKIGEVKFKYFNPEAGKYETAISSPIVVKVKSITSKVKTVEI